jgi:hypothetical protein
MSTMMASSPHVTRRQRPAGRLLCLAGLAMSTALLAAPLTLYVAPGGNDAWSGRTPAPGADGAGPFATLQRARDELRKLKQAGPLPAGGAVVEVAAGTYELAQPLELTAEDSGTAEAPIVYRAAPGAEVRLVGGRQVTNFVPVTDPAALGRLDEGARGKVFQADLKTIGISDFGEVVGDSNRLELFFQDQPMTLARWPNEGFVRIMDVVGGAPHRIHGIPGDKIGKFVYDGDRPSRWLKEPDVWLHGYWFWDWSEQRQQIESIDLGQRVISLKPPYHGYGYRKNQWYYAVNLLCELDSPGEWYLDRGTSTLYFWPPAPIERGKAVVSLLPVLVSCKDTSHVSFRGFVLEVARNTGVSIAGGQEMRVVGCTIRNTGGGAVSASGLGHGVIGCDITQTGGGGISLNGGDRNALTPAGLFADNNHVHHYARWRRVYNPGISLYGVGNRATHNLIDNAPHMAMGFGGNDHLIEFNEIHSVCYESNDAGAIYTGRDWSMCGTVIRHNYLHHINGFEGRGCVGVYLDDQFGGTQIYGNLFYNVTRAAMIGGGRHCTIENNIFVDCVPATHVDSRGLGWAASGREGLEAKLKAFAYLQPPWSERYPYLVKLLEEDPMAPVGNLIARNICVGGRWGDFDGKAKPLVTFQDNLLDQDPRFVDAARQDFSLRADSPAWALGFKAIPREKIGLYQDEGRASWPVVSEVRAMAAPPPKPATAARQGGPVVAKVPRRTAAIAVDGQLTPAEWPLAESAKGIALEQGFQGEKVSPPSTGWLAWDDEALYVAVDSAVNPKFPIRPGNQWGQDDAVELAVRNPGAGKEAPILVLRGFPSGHFASSDEAGAPETAVKRAAEGVQYKAQVVDAKRWTAEWRVPFAALGVDPAKHSRLQFNLSVRKTADDLWVEWQSTLGCTWEVERAGVIELVR